MNSHITFHCPQCGQQHSYELQQPQYLESNPIPAKPGISQFASGSVINSYQLPNKWVRTPIHKLEISHFFISGFMGLFAGMGLVLFINFACLMINNLCYSTDKLLIGAALVSVGTFIATLKLIDNGRYQEKQEVTQVKEITKIIPVSEKPKERLVIVDKQSDTPYRQSYVTLPNGLTYEDIQPIARAVLRNDFVFSRGSLVKQRLITDYTCRQLIDLFIERGLLTKQGRSTVATNAGKRAFSVMAREGFF